MKKFKTLRIFGGSTSVPRNFVDPKDSFWGLTAKAAGIDTIVNYSWVGNSFDSICHVMISEQNTFKWQDDFFLIVLPPLERWTVFDDHKDTQSMAYQIHTKDWEPQPFEVMSHHGLINISFSIDKSTVVFEDRAWTEVTAMRTIFFLTKWLDSSSINYLIINGSKSLDQNNIWSPSDFLLSYCTMHPRVKIFSDTYSSVNIGINYPADFETHGWNGHHSAAGNQRFFDLGIYPWLKKLNLC